MRNRLGYYSTRHTKNIPSQSFIYIYEPRKTWPARRDTHSTLTHTVYRLIDKDPAPCVLLFYFLKNSRSFHTHKHIYTHGGKFFFQTILPRNDEFLYNKNCVALSPEEEEEEETRAEITRDWPSGRLRHDCDRSRCLQQRALSPLELCARTNQTPDCAIGAYCLVTLPKRRRRRRRENSCRKK